MNIIERVRRTIESHTLLVPGDRVVVGLSGGADSVSLLEILSSLKDEYNLTLIPAHLNHRFRGDESDGDDRFCRDISARHGLKLVSEGVDLPALIREKGLSPQAGARQVRYDFFRRTAAARGASRIALGHHADDQAETFLMRLLRGAGSRGLSGIPVYRDPGVIRPLLEIRRREILEFLEERGVAYREDSSNSKDIYLRNRIRLELLPLLAERYNPTIVDGLCTTADLLREEDDYLRQLAEEHFDPIPVDDGFAIDLSAMQSLHPALVRRVVRMAASHGETEDREISARHVSAVIALMSRPGSSARVDLPGDLEVRKVYDRLEFRCRREAEDFTGLHRLPPSGREPIVALGIEVECQLLSPGEVTGPENRNTALLDYERCVPPLAVRTRIPGDTFCPEGLGGTKKVKRFFIDEKIPSQDRKSVPLFVNRENQILWVGGFRRDARFAADDRSALILRLEIRPLSESSP